MNNLSVLTFLVLSFSRFRMANIPTSVIAVNMEITKRLEFSHITYVLPSSLGRVKRFCTRVVVNPFLSEVFWFFLLTASAKVTVIAKAAAVAMATECSM